MKTRVAVFFGGRSPEHDVSIYTGLNALESLDQQRFSAFPVYVAPTGEWLTGDALRNRASYIPRGATYDSLESVTLDLTPNPEGIGRLLPRRAAGGLFAKKKDPLEFDVALIAFHGSHGEDGCAQGLFQLVGVPYSGMRVMGSAVFMDKAITKRVLAGSGIGLLPHVTIDRPTAGLIPSADDVARALGDMRFPVIVKPMHLGSSIGVSRATSIEEVRAALPTIFKLDQQAILEPFVDNLVEYNVAVRNTPAGIQTSAIERPVKKSDVLDFKSKYGSGDDDVSAVKRAGVMNRQTLAGTREINPQLPADLEHKIRAWATTCYAILGGAGAPRIDFLCNGVTNEVWLNEVNPLPGWNGFFLWEAAKQPVLYPELLSALIDEAFALHRASRFPDDPVPKDAQMFPRS